MKICIRLALVASLLLVANLAVADSVVGATGSSTITTNPNYDSVYWQNYWADFQSVPASATLTTSSGLEIVVMSSGDMPGSPAIGPQCGGSVTACGWGGNFNPGERVLYNQDKPSGFSFDFNRPLYGFGTQFQACCTAGDESATLVVYAGDVILTTIKVSGTSTGAADGSAPYIGVFSTAGNITKVVVTGFNSSGDTNFAIGHLAVRGASI